MTSDERLEMIRNKLKEVSNEITDLYDFIAITEALTTDKHTAERIRKFMEDKGVWSKLEK